MKIPDEARLTQEEGEAAVNEKLDFIRLNRGHWEDVVPIVADLQLTKAAPIIEALARKEERERLIKKLEAGEALKEGK